MSIKLVNAYVLVKRDDPTTTTKGGLLIPDSALRKSDLGVVYAVGEARFDNGEKMHFDVKEGDRVIFRKTDGEQITVDGIDVLLLSFAQIIGVLE